MSGSSVIITAQAEQAIREFERFRAEATGSLRNISSLSGELNGMLVKLGATVGSGLMLKSLAHQVVDAQREFDKLNATLTTATGSTANAAQAFKALQAFAGTTPYSLNEATEAFIKMRNMGLDPSERALRSYGNTSAVMGKGLNQMIEAVADAATGEFERLKEFGIKAKQNGDHVSLTFQGVTKVIGNNAREIETYLQNLGETNFGGGMEMRAATLDGAISNLGDTWEGTMRTIAKNGIGEAMQADVLGVTGALTDLSAILDAVAGAADKEGKAVKEASGLHKSLTTVFETVAVLGVNVAYTFQQVGNELGGLAAQAAAVATGDFAGAKRIGELMKSDAEQARKDVDARTEAILGAAVKVQKATEEAAAAKKAAGRDDLAQYKTVQTEAEKAEALARKHADFIKKYATDQEQLNEELKKQRQELGATFTAADEARIRKHYADKDEGAKKSAAATKQELEAYAGLTAAIRTKIGEGQLALSQDESVTESQKTQIKLDQDLASGKLKLSATRLAVVHTLLAEQAATEALLKAQQSEKSTLDWIIKSTQARNASKDALAAEYAMYGKSGDAHDIAMVAIQAETDLQAELTAKRKAHEIVTEETIGQMRREKDMLVEVIKARLAESKALGYATQLASENKRFSAEYIFDAQARANALLQIDDVTWQERIKFAGKGTEAQKKLQGEYSIWYQNQLAKPQLDEWKGSVEKYGGIFRQGFADMLNNGKAGWNSFTKSLTTTFRTAVADQIYKMFAQPFVVKMVASLMGVTGGGLAGAAQAATAASAGGAAMNLIGSTGSAISAAGTLFGSTAVSAFGSGLAASAGGADAAMLAYATATGNLSAGAAAGASVGNAAAGFGSSISSAIAAIPGWGWAALAAAAAVAYFSNDGPEKSTRLAFGSNNAAGAISINERGNEGKSNAYVADVASKGAFGSFGVVSTFWMEAAQPAVQSFVKTVTQTDDALAKFMTSTEQAATAAALTGHVMTSNSGAEGSDPNGLHGLDAVFSDRIKMIFDVIDPALNALLDGFKGSSQELATEATALLDYRKNLPAVSEALFGATVTLQDLAGLRTPTEAVSAALARVTNAFTSTNAVIEPLGISAKNAFGAIGLASLDARQQLIDAAGGMGTLTAGASNFAQHFLTDADRLAPVTEALSKRMTDLGYAGVATAAGYKGAVMELVASGAIATKAGSETYVELLKLSGGFSDIGGAAEQLAKSRRSLEIDIMTLQGNTAGALAAKRADELIAMDASLRPLQERKNALEDAAAALSTNNSLLDIQSQIYELTGDKAGAAAILHQQHAAALVAMDPALRGATEKLWGLQAAATAMEKVKSDASDLTSNVDGAFSSLQKVVGREKDLLTSKHDLEIKQIEKQIDTTKTALTAHKSLADALHSTLDQMLMAGTEAADRASAQAQVRAALAIGRAGGPLPGAGPMKGALSVLTRDSTNLFATMQDYQRDFYATQNDIADLGKLSDIALSVEEKSLKTLVDQKDIAQATYEAEIKRLDDIVSGEQAQVDLLKGIDTSALTIAQAMEGVRGAILTALANPIVGSAAGINGAYQAALGRGPDAKGMEFWQNQAAAGTPQSDILDAIKNSPEAKAQALFKSVLGRTGDAAGMDFWTKQLASGVSESAARDAFKQSDEYKHLMGIPGFESGGDHAGGLRWVGERSIELEATGPARIHSTRDLMDGLRNPSNNNDALLVEIRQLRIEVAEQRKAIERGNEDAKRTANALHGQQGMPFMVQIESP